MWTLGIEKKIIRRLLRSEWFCSSCLRLIPWTHSEFSQAFWRRGKRITKITRTVFVIFLFVTGYTLISIIPPLYFSFRLGAFCIRVVPMWTRCFAVNVWLLFLSDNRMSVVHLLRKPLARVCFLLQFTAEKKGLCAENFVFSHLMHKRDRLLQWRPNFVQPTKLFLLLFKWIDFSPNNVCVSPFFSCFSD